jgi:hypothetical protein
MSFDRLRKPLLAGLCLLTLGVLIQHESSAAKPGGGGGGIAPAPGTIYFSRLNVGPMQMNGDGSGKTAAPNFGWPSVPSSANHAGSRWFLAEDYDWDGALDPWGNPPVELFAVNHTGLWVQLTGGDSNVRRNNEWGAPAWAKDDSFVSFPAVTNTDSGVGGGLHVVSLDWSSGAPVAGPPVLVVETEVYEDPDWWGWSTTSIDFRHDWSPDGDRVALEAYDGEGLFQLFVATISPTGVQLDPLMGHNAEWSPDGGRIAVDSGGSVWTVHPNGTGAVRLTQATTTSKEQRRQGGPTWSPDGAFIAFTEAVTKSSGIVTYSVLRIGSAGGTTVNLTSDIGSASGPRWRN